MIISFLGAARTVTGSMHLVETNGSRILLDCGLFQGRRSEAYERNRNFPFHPADIDAVILSHAHIDHSGNLPHLVKQGFAGPIYCTPPTADLAAIMLADSGHIHERDAEYVNKRHRKRGEPAIEPLYTVEDARKAMQHVESIRYETWFEVADGVSARFVEAGHILGSASVVLCARENGTTRFLGFTGDLGRKNMPIIRDPIFMGDVDVLISESTYGGKVHDPPDSMAASLEQVIRRTVDRGGKIVVPAFSVGRTQEVLYTLHVLYEQERLPRIPIYLDSPLAIEATEVFRKHREAYDDETKTHLRLNHDPLALGQLRFVRTTDESRSLNDLSEPCIIIAASGMCEAGRILHHLANTVEDSRNTVLIVGFQAEHTLGRKLVEKWDEVKIFGDVYKRRAEVVVLNSFSAHAGGDELVDYIGQFDKRRLCQTFLVHGELERAERLRAALGERGLHNVGIPERGEKAEIK